MDISEDGYHVNEKAARIALHKAMEVSTSTAKLILILAINAMNSRKHLKAGENNLNALINNARATSEMPVKFNRQEIKEIIQSCKQEGIPVACLKNKNEFKLVYRTDEIGRLEKAIEGLIKSKVESKENESTVNINKQSIDINKGKENLKRQKDNISSNKVEKRSIDKDILRVKEKAANQKSEKTKVKSKTKDRGGR